MRKSKRWWHAAAQRKLIKQMVATLMLKISMDSQLDLKTILLPAHVLQIHTSHALITWNSLPSTIRQVEAHQVLTLP